MAWEIVAVPERANAATGEYAGFFCANRRCTRQGNFSPVTHQCV